MKLFLPFLAAASLLAATQPALAQKVRLATSAGDIVVELNADKAPRSAANFMQYVNAGHYDGTIFHRVIENFMIQGGGFTADGAQKPVRTPIPLEAGNGLSNLRGTLSMARTAAPDSATAQFFINVVDNPGLDTAGGGYAVFGKVVTGMDIVDKIKGVATANRGGAFQDRPVTDIVITKATVEK